MNNRPTEMSKTIIEPMEPNCLYGRSVELLKEAADRQEYLLTSLTKMMVLREPNSQMPIPEFDAEFEEEATLATMINHQIDRLQALGGKLETLCKAYEDQVGDIKIIKL